MSDEPKNEDSMIIYHVPLEDDCLTNSHSIIKSPENKRITISEFLDEFLS